MYRSETNQSSHSTDMERRVITENLSRDEQ